MRPPRLPVYLLNLHQRTLAQPAPAGLSPSATGLQPVASQTLRRLEDPKLLSRYDQRVIPEAESLLKPEHTILVG